MRSAETRYPVDRYLVESSKKFDMVNIIDDDIWNSEPALRPEDEIILRKLHDMLQSTADELKLLSGELSKYRDSNVQKKTLPTPLDEEFNEKVYIEEVVNARFHGPKTIETKCTPRKIQKDLVDGIVQSIASKCNNKQFVSHGVQVNQAPTLKKSPTKKILGVSRTNVIQISKPTENKIIDNNNERTKKNNKSVKYNEFSYKYAETKPTIVKKPLQVQTMPSINIRSELKEQKVLQIDIHPNSKEIHESETAKSNALVIEMKHEDTPIRAANKSNTFDHISYIPPVSFEKPTTRKISKMSAYESESTNSSESQNTLRKNIKKSFTLRSLQRPTHVVSQKAKKNVISKIEEGKRNLDEWHKKLNAVYGGTSKFKNSGIKKTKVSPKKLDIEKTTTSKKTTSQVLNNAEYIPYSKLTIGGVNVSDIEREISNIPNKGEIVLSPILDKILSSRENSFHNDSPRKTNKNKILTTSDEDLLQEVLDIEKEISKSTSTKNENDSNNLSRDQINKESHLKDGNSYDDDFEDEKSNDSEQANQSQVSKSDSSVSIPLNDSNKDNNYEHNQSQKNEKDIENIRNRTYTKISNLSFKNTVDIFEFVHSVDTQDIATQSNTSNKVTHQEHQTSSSDDKSNVQPIHNDLWPSVDPRGEVEKMFKLEKEFIKKLIIDEYGDLLEKQLNKPSTSKHVDNCSEKNVSSSQKNTQTSPAHVKSVMTSPTKTKTRTTSPFVVSQPVNQQTSPIVAVSKEEELKIEIEKDENLSISVNLSSPRFSLRLPQTTREVLSNIKYDNSYNSGYSNTNILPRNLVSSSSSGAEDYSSSDISSLGQIHKIFKRRLRKSSISSISEISSSSSSLSRYSRYSSNRSGVLPLKSEGEASIGKINNKISNKLSRSEGEVSLGQLN